MESKNIIKFTLKASSAVIGTMLIVVWIKLSFEPKNYSNTQDSLLQAQNAQSTNANKWASKTDDQANVVVEVTPVDLSPRSAEWKFNIIMNTHAVELDQDIVAAAVLTDDLGREYKPFNWEGSPPGGHHRSGMLVFSPIVPASRSIELRILGIGGVDRNFIWQL